MENNREKLLSFIRINGPILPVQVSKYLGTNIIFAGAMLSELASNNHIFISNTKRGGSPFYYVKGQEQKLQNISIFLPSKEKEAYEIIKQKKVIRDKDLEPWQRIALRAIKDFALPIEVEFEGNTELFWKWYMVSNEEVNSLINQLLESLNPKITQESALNSTTPKESIQMELPNEQVIVDQDFIKAEVNKPAVRKTPKKEVSTEFINELMNYLKNSEIKIIEQNIVKQNKEIDFILEVPTKIGYFSFYGKAKSKATINESDLALAYSIGQQRKLHTLFLSKGTITKKAKEYINKNLNGQITFISIN